MRVAVTETLTEEQTPPGTITHMHFDHLITYKIIQDFYSELYKKENVTKI